MPEFLKIKDDISFKKDILPFVGLIAFLIFWTWLTFFSGLIL